MSNKIKFLIIIAVLVVGGIWAIFPKVKAPTTNNNSDQQQAASLNSLSDAAIDKDLQSINIDVSDEDFKNLEKDLNNL